MGSFISSEHPGNQFVFLPPTKSDYEIKSSNHTALIDGTLHKIPIVHAIVSGFQTSLNKRCLVYSHGNGADLYSVGDIVTMLAYHLNVDVIGYDYTGYGYTQCLTKLTPSESRCITCLEDVVSYAKCMGYEEIMLMGASVGSGVTLGYVKKVGGFDGKVILESPFTSIFSVVNMSCQNSMLDMFSNIDNIAYVKRPAFILHGNTDEVVPFYHGKELYERHVKNLKKDNLVPYNPWWMKNTGHNDIIAKQGIALYTQKLKEYISS